jgi:hypothetical protein
MNRELGLLEFNAGKFKGAIGGMFSGLASGISTMVLKPLELGAKAAMGMGAGLLALGGYAVKSAGDLESLMLRLEGVTSSKEEADAAFKTAMDLSIASPFTPSQMVETSIGLRNLGIVGKEAMVSIGNAASLTQRDMGDIVSMIAGMESEPLRRMGIGLKTDNGQYTFSYRDKMDQVNEVVAQGVDEAREKLLGIFDVKFGGGMEKFAKSWKGVWSTFIGVIDFSAAELGKPLKDLAIVAVGQLNTMITGLAESGKLKDIGTNIAVGIANAAGIMVEAWESLVGGSSTWGEKLKAIMLAAGQTLATAFAHYLVAYSGVGVAFAKVMAAAFGESLLQLPGMGLMRDTAFQAKKGYKNFERFSNPEAAAETAAYEAMTPLGQAAYVLGDLNSPKSITDSLAHAHAGLSGVGQQMQGQLGSIWGQAAETAGIGGGLSGIEERGRARAEQWIVNIQNMTVDSDRDSQLRDSIKRQANAPLPAGGGM